MSEERIEVDLRKLREILKKRGIQTDKAIAEALKINTSTYSSWAMAGKVPAYFETLIEGKWGVKLEEYQESKENTESNKELIEAILLLTEKIESIENTISKYEVNTNKSMSTIIQTLTYINNNLILQNKAMNAK